MKNLILLVILLSSVASQAEWIRGTLTFKDKTVKTGYVKSFVPYAKKIWFRNTIKDKEVSYPSEVLTSIEMHLKNGKSEKSYFIHEAEFTILTSTPKLKIKKYSAWLDSLYEGDFKVLTMYFYGGTSRSELLVIYYINWPGEDYATSTDILKYGRKNDFLAKNYIRQCTQMTFKCDKMTEAIFNLTFKPKVIEDVIGFYEKNCGSDSLQTLPGK